MCFRQPTVALVAVVVAVMASLTNSKCDFEAIFNFGDSNTDTGGFWAAFPAQGPPNGMTFFKKPAGRATDGRVIVDFLAQAFGLPFLRPYLQSIGSDYKHGVNFATLASTVHQPFYSQYVTGVSPFYLSIQVNQMKYFKSLVDSFSSSTESTSLPPPDIFGKALYTFYIGQNDFTGNLASIGIVGVQKLLPDIVGNISSAIKEVYGLGGRTFFVLNLAPIGCYPAFLVQLPHNNSDIDEFGCLISYNNAVVEYNKLLNNALFRINEQLSGANVINVDIHTAMLELFQHPTSHGLKYGTVACCGEGGGSYNYNPQIFCGNSKVINGTTRRAEACDDPYNYVSWDGVHATEAANKLMSNAILSGNYFDPPFNLHQYCDIQPIG